MLVQKVTMITVVPINDKADEKRDVFCRISSSRAVSVMLSRTACDIGDG